jgi:hypothetical protein
MKEDTLLKLFVPLVLGLFVALGGWCWGRMIKRGKPLTSVMKIIVVYFAIWATGAVYFMAWDDKIRDVLSYPNEQIWIPLSVAWAALLAFMAWRKIQRDANPAP